MSDTKEVAVTKQQQLPQAYIPSKEDWFFMLDWAVVALKSGMLPNTLKTPESVAVVILKGRELGISFMTALSQIFIVTGKPSMSAELIQSMARKNLPGLMITIVESTDKIAKVEFKRPEANSKPYTESFSMEDAVKAKLEKKEVWQAYPKAMLWSRAVTAGLRKVCPEALMGISHTPEELGAAVNESGEVIETTGRHIHDPKPEAPKEEPKQEVPKGKVISPAKSDEYSAEEKEERKKLLTQIIKDGGVLGLSVDDLIEMSVKLFKKADAKLLTTVEMHVFCSNLNAMIMGKDETNFIEKQVE